MTEFEEITGRIKASVNRVPDRLTARGAPGLASRAEFSRIFAQCILAHEANADFISVLPFQVSLLTDPHIYIVAGGLLVLDHPTKPEQFQSAFNAQNVQVVALHKKASLYEGRHPRLIAYPRKGEKIEVSWMRNRLMQCEFRGPFSELKGGAT